MSIIILTKSLFICKMEHHKRMEALFKKLNYYNALFNKIEKTFKD